MNIIESHREFLGHKEAKAIRQGTKTTLEAIEVEWESSLERHERQFHPAPEQPQSVWDHVWNLGREATRERMFA